MSLQVWDFLPRIAAAAGLEMEMPRRGEHGPQLSAILYFLDLSHVRPDRSCSFSDARITPACRSIDAHLT